MKRRHILGLALSSLTFLSGFAHAADVKTLRIGYQKTSILLVVKGQKNLEDKLEAKGIKLEWVEFAFGPPLLEALNAGSLDYGYTGDSPPIFAQAARPNLLYVGAIPARGYGQGIIVPPSSEIKTLADLKGKTIGVAKASSAHNLLIVALEDAHLGLSDVNIAYLAPADAAAAFSKGAIDAWSIWDPYLAIAELSKGGARLLPLDRDKTAQNSFFLANRDFARDHADLVKLVNSEIEATTQWINGHRDEAAQIFADASGVALDAQKKSVDRAEFTFGPLTETVLDQQQAVADRFFKLGLLPKQIRVRDIVWDPKSAS